eukprot:763928-Hanusia_phi.AAC.3
MQTDQSSTPRNTSINLFAEQIMHDQEQERQEQGYKRRGKFAGLNADGMFRQRCQRDASAVPCIAVPQRSAAADYHERKKIEKDMIGDDEERYCEKI